MDVTRVMAYFSIFGDEFPLEEITGELAIEPTDTHNKGDIIEPAKGVVSTRVKQRLETDWTLSTGYQDSYDINDQLKPLLSKLEGKQNALTHLKNKYNIEYLFMVVIEIENNRTPATYLEKDVIDFAAAVGAEIHFDMYVYN